MDSSILESLAHDFSRGYGGSMSSEPWQGHYRPSEIGGCLRYIFLKKMGIQVAQPIGGTTGAVREDGFLHEDDIIARLMMSGHNITQRNLVLEMTNPLHIIGHPDGIMDGKYLLEIKALGSIGFANLAAESAVNPELPFRYMAQIQVYLHCVVKMFDISQCIMVVKDRNASKTRFFGIDYSQELTNQVFSRILHMSDNPPRECHPGDGQYFYCPYARTVYCYGNLPPETLELREAAALWREGKKHDAVASDYIAQARSQFSGVMKAQGKDEVLVDGVVARLSPRTRTTWVEDVLKELVPDELALSRAKRITVYEELRIREV